MNTAIKKSLEDAYQKVTDMVINVNLPDETDDDVIAANFTGFGTVVDEKLFSKDSLSSVLQKQNQQIIGQDIQWNLTPLYRQFSQDGNMVIFADNVNGSVKIGNEIVQIHIRMTLVFELIETKWMLVHLHASKPEDAESTKGTFGIEIYKERNAQLEKIVKERTVELSKRNREIEIEASLEKVRSVALGIKKSDGLLDILEVLYQQLYALGFKNIRNAIIDLHTDDKGGFLDYDYSPEMGKSITKMNYHELPVIEKQIKQKNATTDGFFEIILEGKDLEELKALRIRNGEQVDERLNQIEQLTYNFYSFDKGEIGISTFGVLEDEQKVVLKRFRNVFSFAYTRYSELLDAESRIREAQIEAALEKVRSSSMSMQKSSALAETSIVVFEQLINLGIEPNRLFIGIINEEDNTIEAWASNEDGTKIGSHFTLDKDKNKYVAQMYESWKENETSITIEMKGIDLENYFRYLSDELHISFKKGLFQKRRSQTLAYFSQGLIGMASPEKQPQETIQLLERFAAVFNLAYTRFNDLKFAEAQSLQAEKDLLIIKTARKEAEESLIELQSAQKRLIQSEKMASLGELTAGVAHEIQNPLNFVNNFSEVSSELLAEMLDEINKGNLDDAKDLLKDIIQNLIKITHHGKRADTIVKGMLLHSRSSTGIKEPTDLNELCQEYLRLSYHGLRAKDKSFNATINTNFDESIGTILLIPQEFGRVILNLVNNAFYAVNEKKRLNVENYKPTVSIATKKENQKIIITVTDNGNGIPQKVLEKIFQPFFTTKPTGQGTGLGLSLSYDIVQTHGGELMVETTEGIGTSFVIVLEQ